MSEPVELRAWDGVVVADDASVEVTLRRPVSDVALRAASVVCGVASLGIVVMQSEDGVFTALILYALGALALLVVTLARVRERVRDRVAHLVVAQDRITLDGQSIERASVTALALRRRGAHDVLTLSRGERAQPLVSFDDHAIALDAGALLASRLGVALTQDEHEPEIAARSRWAITAAASGVVASAIVTWIVLAFRSLAYSEHRLGTATILTMWAVTLVGLSLMRVGFRRAS